VAVIEHVTRRQTPLTAGQCVTVRPWRRRGTGSGPDGARELAPSAIACPRSSDTGISTTSLAVTGAARCSFGRGTTSTAQRNACARLACNGTARGGDRRLSPRPADSWSARHWGAPAPRCAERRCVVLTRLQMPCRSRRHRPRKHSPTRSGPRPSSAGGHGVATTGEIRVSQRCHRICTRTCFPGQIAFVVHSPQSRMNKRKTPLLRG
jgi:hypothetical protein